MRVGTILLGTALGLSMVGGASAAVERHGWYVGLEGGRVKVQDSELPAWGYATSSGKTAGAAPAPTPEQPKQFIIFFGRATVDLE